jgi:HSP20 family protein
MWVRRAGCIVVDTHPEESAMASQNGDHEQTQALQARTEITTALARLKDQALARALEQGPFAFMRQLFEDLEETWAGVLPRRFREVVELPFVPQVEVSHHDGKLVVECDLPGISADDLEVSIDQNALIIAGERRTQSEVEEDDRVWRSERAYGVFRRVIPLPEGADADSAQASFADGVLEISIQAPHPPRAQTRKIEIRKRESH